MPHIMSEYVSAGPNQEYCHSHWCAENPLRSFVLMRYIHQSPAAVGKSVRPCHGFDPCRKLLEQYQNRLGKKGLPDYQPGELDSKPHVQQQAAG